MKKEHYFKDCSYCGFVWQDRDKFLNDDEIEIVGYQQHFKELQAGLFLFNHSCNGTISIKVGHFTDLYDGPIFQKRKLHTDECSEHCLYTDSDSWKIYMRRQTNTINYGKELQIARGIKFHFLEWISESIVFSVVPSMDEYLLIICITSRTKAHSHCTRQESRESVYKQCSEHSSVWSFLF